MENNTFQNQSEYKSLIKTLAYYAQNVVNAKSRPGLGLDDVFEYRSTLQFLSPALSNLSKELDVFYGSKINTDFDEIEGRIENIEALVIKINTEIEHNKEFKDVSLAFDLKSPLLQKQLEQAFNYTQSSERDFFEDKSMYWLYNSVVAADSNISDLTYLQEEHLWGHLEKSDIAVRIASKLQHKNYSGNEEDYLQDLEAGIFDTCIAFTSGQETSLNDVLSVLLDNYRKACPALKVDENGYAEAITPHIPEIKKIIQEQAEHFQKIEKISDITDEFHQKIWTYEHQSILDIIKYQQLESQPRIVADFLNDDNGFTEILESNDYDSLIRETEKEFLYYQHHQKEIDIFENVKVTDNILKIYFGIMIKKWAEDTNSNLDYFKNKAIDIYLEPQMTASEIIDTNIELLERAKDILLVGKIIPEYFKAEDGSEIILSNSHLKLEYIDNLLSHPKKMKKQDYENLSILYDDFSNNYYQNNMAIKASPGELYLLENTKMTEFARILNYEPDSSDKYKMIFYSYQYCKQEKKQWDKQIKHMMDGFGKKIRPLYQKEYQNLKNYIAEGSEIFPELKSFNILNYCESTINALVLMPLYSGQRIVTKKEWGNYLNSSIDGLGLDDVSNSFVKSAINGYRHQVIKKYPKIQYTREQATKLSSQAQRLISLNKSWREADIAQDKFNALLSRMDKQVKAVKKLKEYRSTLHPEENFVTKALLNFKSKSY